MTAIRRLRAERYEVPPGFNPLALETYQSTVAFSTTNDVSMAEALCFLGYCLREGIGVEKNVTHAVQLLERSANLGHLHAQFLVGICYEDGAGVVKNLCEAFRWYEKAAVAGYGLAEYKVSECYYQGQGVDKDPAKAAFWAEKATSKKIPDAYCVLGNCLLHGLGGIPADEVKAASLYKMAAEMDWPRGLYNLGYCYENGKGIEKCEKTAVEFYVKAADMGFAPAQYNLALCIQDGRGTTKDKKEALKYYFLAAEQGDADAQCNIGFCFQRGIGVPQDLAASLEWYKRAAASNQEVATYNIGVCYENGIGVAADVKQAIFWFKKAADIGHPKAQYFLANYFYNGKNGIPKNIVEALKYYELSMKKGFDLAKNCIYTHKDLSYLYYSQHWPELHFQLSLECQNAIIEIFCSIFSARNFTRKKIGEKVSEGKVQSESESMEADMEFQEDSENPNFLPFELVEMLVCSLISVWPNDKEEEKEKKNEENNSEMEIVD